MVRRDIETNRMQLRMTMATINMDREVVKKETAFFNHEL